MRKGKREGEKANNNIKLHNNDGHARFSGPSRTKILADNRSKTMRSNS